VSEEESEVQAAVEVFLDGFLVAAVCDRRSHYDRSTTLIERRSSSPSIYEMTSQLSIESPNELSSKTSAAHGAINCPFLTGFLLLNSFQRARRARRQWSFPIPHAVSNGSGEKILLVNGEPCIRKAAQRVLEGWGHQPLVPGDGVSVLALYVPQPNESSSYH
jgi:hypothetical protein